MVLRRLRPARPAGATSPSIAPLRDDAAPILKANVLAFTIGCALIGLTCAAVLAPSPALAAQTIDSPAQQDYAIPAGRLSEVLARFAATAGVPLSFDPQMLAGLRSDGLQGRYTVREGFARLLAGSDYELVDTGNGGYSLRQVASAGGEATLPAVTVRADADDETATGPVVGYVARRSATGTKTDTPIIETPQSVAVVTRDQMDTQGAQTVSEALRYTAGVLTGTGGGQTRFDTVFIRGFGGLSNGSNFTKYVDGLGWPHIARTSVQMDPYALERVKVLRGPSSVLFGQADPGGFVNMVSKRPTAAPLREAMLQVGNHDAYAVGLDLSGPLAGDALSYRVAGLVRDAQTGVDYQKDERRFISPSIRWSPSDATALTVYAFYQDDPQQPDTSFVPPAFAGVGPVQSPYGKLPKHYFQGDPNWNLFDRTIKTAGWTFEHRFDEVWQFRQSLRYGEFESDTRQLNNGTPAANFQTLPRTASHNTADVDTLAVDNQVQAQFRTGAIAHTVLLGVDWRDADFLAMAGSGPAPARTNVYAPVYGLPITPVTLSMRTDSDARQLGLYAQNQMRVGRWALLAGLRQDDAKSSTYNTSLLNGTRGATTRQSDKSTTGRVGAVYLMDNGFAPYASYATSFEPVVGADRLGDPFDPTEGRQVEAGMRWQPAQGRSLVTVSLYELTKRNVLTADPVAPTQYSVQTGEIRSRGFEIEGKLELTTGLNLLANYAYSDVEVTRDNIAGRVGKRPLAVSEQFASAWMDYSFSAHGQPGLTLGAGVRYVGASYGDETNTLRVPAYTLLDAMARYEFNSAWTLTLNAKNLENKQYAAACAYGTCWQGIGRTVQATLRYRW